MGILFLILSNDEKKKKTVYKSCMNCIRNVLLK